MRWNLFTIIVFTKNESGKSIEIREFYYIYRTGYCFWTKYKYLCGRNGMGKHILWSYLLYLSGYKTWYFPSNIAATRNPIMIRPAERRNKEFSLNGLVITTIFRKFFIVHQYLWLNLYPSGFLPCFWPEFRYWNTFWKMKKSRKWPRLANILAERLWRVYCCSAGITLSENSWNTLWNSG